MEILVVATLVALALWQLKRQEQARRIMLLGRHLGQYQIEKHLETLTQGYLRALGEDDPERRNQIWSLLTSTEQALNSQFSRFAADFAREEEAATRVSRLPFYIPFAVQLLPAATFDIRAALAVHARGISLAAQGGDVASAKARAYTMTAELFLMQHTCHWFCKSKLVASARMVTRHQTTYEQLVAAVAPQTRAAYGALVGIA